MKRIISIVLIAALVGCAGTGAAYRPLIDVGRGNVAAYESDLSDCQRYAAQVAGAAERAAAGAIIGALFGAALAAAAGSGYSRNSSATVGAVAGAAQGGAGGERDQRTVIRRCLAGRGYSVLH